MRTAGRIPSVAAAALLVALAAPATAAAAPPDAAEPQLLFGELDGGSGSTVGPGGDLYVTEPVSGDLTRVDRRTGETTTVADCLPERVLPDGPGGAMDVAFRGRTAYVLVSLVGPDVGGDDVVGLYRVDAPDTCTVVADIGAWAVENPPETDFFVPSGLQYAMEAVAGGFLVTDGHHNRVLYVTTEGDVSEVLALDNVVPTGLATHGRGVLLALAGPVPHEPETGRVVAFRPGDDHVREVASGGRLLVDVERGRGGVYALSQGVFTPGNPEGSPADPDTGQLLRVTRDGGFEVVAGPLDRPTSMEVVGRTAYVVTLDGEIWTVDLRG
ncbi:ScyD/ScyE family protein [Geodermatophilus sp. SYSU D00766]